MILRWRSTIKLFLSCKYALFVKVNLTCKSICSGMEVPIDLDDYRRCSRISLKRLLVNSSSLLCYEVTTVSIRSLNCSNNPVATIKLTLFEFLLGLVSEKVSGSDLFQQTNQVNRPRSYPVRSPNVWRYNGWKKLETWNLVNFNPHFLSRPPKFHL